jgi:hypothetical protein
MVHRGVTGRQAQARRGCCRKCPARAAAGAAGPAVFAVFLQGKYSKGRQSGPSPLGRDATRRRDRLCRHSGAAFRRGCPICPPRTAARDAALLFLLFYQRQISIGGFLRQSEARLAMGDPQVGGTFLYHICSNLSRAKMFLCAITPVRRLPPPGRQHRCLRQLEMSLVVPFRNVTIAGFGRRAGAEPRRSAAPARRPPHRTWCGTISSTERAPARSARRRKKLSRL